MPPMGNVSTSNAPTLPRWSLCPRHMWTAQSLRARTTAASSSARAVRTTPSGCTPAMSTDYLRQLRGTRNARDDDIGASPFLLGVVQVWRDDTSCRASRFEQLG